MAKRRRKQEADPAVAGVGLFIMGVIAVLGMPLGPYWVSISCGVLAVILTFVALLLSKQGTKKAHERKVEEFSWATGRNFYATSSPREFEQKVEYLFKQKGYQTQLTPSSGDGGLDIIVTKNGTQTGVECKRYKAENPIGPSHIRDFIGALHGYGLRHGFYATTSRYTDGAVKVAKESGYQIILADGKFLGQWQGKLSGNAPKLAPEKQGLIPTKWWYRMGGGQKGCLSVLVSLIIFIVTVACVLVLALAVDVPPMF